MESEEVFGTPSELDPTTKSGRCCCCCTHCQPLTRLQILALCAGIAFGILISAGSITAFLFIYPSLSSLSEVQLNSTHDLQKTEINVTSPLEPVPTYDAVGALEPEDWTLNLRRPVYIGVLTLERYLDTRATSCNETWGQHSGLQNQGKMDIYVQLASDKTTSQNIVNITGG